MSRVIPGHDQAGTPPADSLAHGAAPAAPPAQPTQGDDLAGEWNELSAAAAALDGQPAPSQAAQAAQARTAAAEADQVREQWGALADMALSLGLPLLGAWRGPSWAAAYGDREQANIRRTLGDLALSQGWSAGETLGRMGPWIAFGGAVLGPVLPLILADANSAGQLELGATGKPTAPDAPMPAPTPHDGQAASP